MSDKITDEMVEAGVKSMRWQLGPPQSKDADMVRGIYTAMSQAHPTDEEEVVELAAIAIRDVSQGEGFDYMDFCRDAARAALNAIRGGE